MPVWIWALMGLTALGFVFWLLERERGLDVTERFGKALTILFILALLAGLIFSFLNADWQ
jgi:membrane-anchored protein YejM (alkaline phosphatase superfamily)